MERARMRAALGAEVVLVDQMAGSVPGQVSGDDLQLVFQETERLTTARSAFRADQFELAANARAHYRESGVTDEIDETLRRRARHLGRIKVRGEEVEGDAALPRALRRKVDHVAKRRRDRTTDAQPRVHGAQSGGGGIEQRRVLRRVCARRARHGRR